MAVSPVQSLRKCAKLRRILWPQIEEKADSSGETVRRGRFGRFWNDLSPVFGLGVNLVGCVRLRPAAAMLEGADSILEGCVMTDGEKWVELDGTPRNRKAIEHV